MPKLGARYMTIAIPSTFLGSHSFLISHGITKEFLVLKCNEWDIRDSIPFSVEVIDRDKGRKKTLIMLNDDYSTDTICFSTDKMGAQLKFVFVPEPVYQMLIYDFFNK